MASNTPSVPYYEDEAVVLYHGDCRDLLPPFRVHATITDPPYNVGIEYGEGTDDGRVDYAEWCASWFRAVRAQSDFVALSPGIANVGLWTRIAGDPDWIMAWHKPGAMGRCVVGFNNWEPVLLWGKLRGRATADSFTAPLVSRTLGDGHPCPKPVKWGRALVSALTKPGDTVLDPFAGSGTVLLACKYLGRRAIGIEIDERYCEIAARRCSQDVLDLAGVA